MRHFLLPLAAITSTLLTASAHSQPAVPNHVVSQQAGGYTVKIGNVRVTSVTDGTVPQDLHALLKRADGQQIDALLRRSYLTNPVEASINAFLIEMPGHEILVDTGSGDLFGPGNGGRMLESMASLGIKPEQITDILITHAHSDHVGGLVRGGKAVFQNATVWIGKPDIDFFFDRSNQAKTGYDKSYFDIAQNMLKPYIDADRLKTFAKTTEVLPGITATLHPGHTPGAAFYTLTSSGEHITFAGDTIHVAAVQFPYPDITITYDQDQDKAAAVRKALFAGAAKGGDLIAVPHLPFPGIGHVRDNGQGGFTWLPVNYTNRNGN